MSLEPTEIAPRSGRASTALALVLVLGTVLPVAAQDRRSPNARAADDRGWYAAAGAGVSRLSPDPDGSSLQLEDDMSTAFGAWIGRDLSSRPILWRLVTTL